MKRQHRLVKATLFINIIILAIGLYVVDSSVNTMLGFQNPNRIILIDKRTDNIFDINFMNNTCEINITYLKKDMEKLAAVFKQSYETCRQYFDNFNQQVYEVMNIK